MYRLGSTALAVALFVAFVPGVLTTLPSKSSGKWTILVVHGLLFAVITHFVMHYYHKHVVFREGFGNYGPSCPKGYSMGVDQVCYPIPTNPHMNAESHVRG